MSDELYDRYREALRLGHLAVRRGLHEAAIIAYREAAALVPDRALPHVGLGNALRMLGRNDEAIAAYEAALRRAPGDEVALSGQVEAWISLGRRAEAAEALDRLAEAHEEAGRLDQALASTRHGLELAESRSRRRRLRRLGGEDEPAGAAVSSTAPAGVAIAEDAASRLEAGDRAGALDGFRAAVAAHRRAGRTAAALDACSLALGVAPDDAEIHLTLVEIYLERGWRSTAADKLALLGRLAELDGDAAVHERVRRLASEHLAGEPRVASLGA
jgi:tetratricopeptide (TPR) repeat protein